MVDEKEIIYGVRLDEDITPIMVRDAIIRCYLKADDEVLNKIFMISDFNSTKDAYKMKRNHVIILIKKVFHDVNGDFDNPTRDNLIEIIDRLRDFASKFRDKEIIDHNYNAIMKLINRLN